MCDEFSNYCSMSSENFWETMNILMSKFNVVNKRLWSSKILYRRICKPMLAEWSAPLKSVTTFNTDNVESYINFVLKHLKLSCKDNLLDYHVEVVLIELLPKQYKSEKAYQLICLDKVKTLATFYDVTPETTNSNLCPNFTYSLSLEAENLVLRTCKECNVKSQEWLVKTLLPQLVNWGKNLNKHSPNICKESLTLICKDRYYKKYNELKMKYGKGMVEIWPEGTDPSKYVYEDVAIATYLLLLWEMDEIPQKKNFVDLGCGNGLLVYILTEEGHNGCGIDVRKRHIWDMYPKYIKLEERSIIPSNADLFPDADWLIGNHSDELTPWIPVIAARSSYRCNFFLLPCCPYNFDGTKYQRKDSSKSQYTEYLEYIKTVCDTCGFDTSIDRLKIPSTKRICLLAQRRTYSQKDELITSIKVQRLFSNNNISTQNNEASWASNFKPRDAVEKVRNCTQIDKSIIESVIVTISKHLLEDYDLEKGWSTGKIANIHDLVKLVSEENLKAMKAECGGLQTLLKNNHHIFRVQKGKVQLRYPRTIEEVKGSFSKNYQSKSDYKVKLKPCWFYNNHPQGCPLLDTDCSYLHVHK